MANRPKPTAIRKLEGNPGHRALNDAEPQYAGAPKPPADLSEAGQLEWDRIVEMLTAVGLATDAEQTILQMYVTAYETWVDATANMRRMGSVVKSPKSEFPMLNPYYPVVNKTFDQMKTCLTELGLTPAAKTKVTANKPAGEVNPWEALKGGRGGD